VETTRQTPSVTSSMGFMGVDSIILDKPPLHPSILNPSSRLPASCDDLGPSVISSPLSLPRSDGIEIVPGCRESEDDDSSLNVVLDSLIPFIHDNNSTIQLPVYLGNTCYDDPTSGGKASTSCTRSEGTGKEYAWSRGLGIEHSPIKTQSSRKRWRV
jgi:hypothetical protein